MSDSGTFRMIPRDPRMLSWNNGPLPETPEPGTAVLVFRPHFSLPCAASVVYLLAAEIYPGGPLVWSTVGGEEPFDDDLSEEDWWAFLGPDAAYVLQKRLDNAT